MGLPRILIVSTKEGKAHEIAHKIGGVTVHGDDTSNYYVWNIQNKYYTAEVLIAVAENSSANFSTEDVEAVIVHDDPQAKNTSQHLEQWSPLVSSLAKAEVLLFTCDSITNSDIRDKVTKWCIQNRFELIELDKTEDLLESDSEHNKYGVDRVIEALHAHMWPNMILKGKPASMYEQDSSVADEANNSDMEEVEEQLDSIKISRDVPVKLQMENVLDGIMGGENADFGELFNQLMAMKEHAASLPTNQRRIAAEQIVTAFWKAMGGDPSEIDD